MQLSQKALLDLRTALNNSYGESFDIELSDDDVNDLGNLFLTALAESLKLEIAHPEIIAK